MNKEVNPTNNFILVKLPGAVEATSGGLLLTGKAKTKKTEGVVVSTGPGKTHHETGALYDMPVQPGENVIYGNFDFTELTVDGNKHVLIRDDDVLVKFTGDQLTMENVEVVRDTILLEMKDEEEEKTESTILIASTSKSKRRNTTGQVVKVGPGRMATNGENMEMDVVPGDFVKFRDFSTADVEIEGTDYVVVRMSDILCKF